MRRKSGVRAEVQAIRARCAVAPTVGVVLGTGLGGVADVLEDTVAIPMTDIPGLPRPTVEGHAGRLVLGRLGGVGVAAFQGRLHLYEGHPPATVALPIRILHALGARSVVLTNAAGSLNPDFAPGDLMLIEDHLFLPGLAGHSPLVGPNDEALGPRFPDMSAAYDPALRDLALAAAAEQGLALRRGTYVMVVGPSFETPAELRALRTLGGDAVGMSTAIEAVAARHLGLRVLGVSCIANPATGLSATPTSHAEVLAAMAQSASRLATLLAAVIPRLGRDAGLPSQGAV